ncbi:hypothetical protein [Alcaligenes endophyticus]|uniref:Uncharacterized protein n=1 Tax=Alcaligenes endophyticus TaxID=1929088 RepID=A0ABT8EIV8_9BURK|nr:hypothetical protein [Alcaligenes endophyticus]MCX5592494.1 hypothetical protein [Alcaligenes endophyticus]MDN4121219.1 hypothetical protein [Alcaligenes endophyticus]
MNAIAEREVRAHELAERRRQAIAKQILECLNGKTESVLLSWGFNSVPWPQNRQELVEGIEDELIKKYKKCFMAKFIQALSDDSQRIDLQQAINQIIDELADKTHANMTLGELEALPC